MFATKINKNPELFFLFLSIRMQPVALVDKTKSNNVYCQFGRRPLWDAFL